MQKLIQLSFSVLFLSHIASSQTPLDTLQLPSNTAISIRIEDFEYGAGVYTIFWINNRYTIRTGLGAYYYTFETSGPFSNDLVTLTESKISPTIALLLHFNSRKNVSPYFGFEARLSWYLQNARLPRYTIFEPSFIFGVEAWVTEQISVSGEQQFGSEHYLNSTRQGYRIKEGFLMISSYF